MNFDIVSKAYTANSPDDWLECAGWEVLFIEPWKDGVKRIHIRSVVGSQASFRMVYASDESLPGLSHLKGDDSKSFEQHPRMPHWFIPANPKRGNMYYCQLCSRHIADPIHKTTGQDDQGVNDAVLCDGGEGS